MDLTTCSSFKARRLHPDQNPFGGNALRGIGSILVGHKCFIFGGLQEEPVMLHIYDRKKNNWSSKQILRNRLAHGQVKMAFTVSDTLFAYVRHYMDRVYYLMTLDLVTPEHWDLVPSNYMPSLTFGVSGCFVERRGEGIVTTPDRSLQPTVVVAFRVEDNVWYSPRVKGKTPRLAVDHSSCATGYQVFVTGEDPSLNRLNLHVLNVTALPFVWSTPVGGSYFPQKRYLFQSSCTVNRIFVYGGFNGKKCFDVYSIREQCWLKNVEFDTDWEDGTGNNAVVQTSEVIIVFGGLGLPARTPLVITPA